MEIYKLKKPVKWDGKEIKELKIDFDGLTVAQIEAAEYELAQFFGPEENIISRDFDKRYYSAIVSAASVVPVQAIRTFNYHDYFNLCMMARVFLVVGEMEDREAETENLSIPGLVKDEKPDR